MVLCYRETNATSSKANKEKKKTKIVNIRNERAVITTDPINIKRIVKEYYEQLDAYKHNLNIIDQLFDRHNQAIHPQGERDKLNRPTSIKEIGLIINNLP